MKEMLAMPDALKYEYKLNFTSGGFSGNQPNFADLQKRLNTTVVNWYQEVAAQQNQDTFYLKTDGWSFDEYTLPKI